MAAGSADTQSPSVVVLGGPNGSGKSTAAPRLLRGSLKVDEFVNADTLAQGLSAFRPEDVAIEAGRTILVDEPEFLKFADDRGIAVVALDAI